MNGSTKVQSSQANSGCMLSGARRVHSSDRGLVDRKSPPMYVDVPHLDCLLVAAPITLEGLDHLILKPKQLDGITAVYVDVVFGHLAMALS